MRYERDAADPALLIIWADPSINEMSSEQTVADLEQMIDDDGVERVIVDLSGISFVNSFALSILMRLRNRLRPKDGAIRVCATNAQIDKIMDITSLTPHLPRCATLAEARESITRSSSP